MKQKNNYTAPVLQEKTNYRKFKVTSILLTGIILAGMLLTSCKADTLILKKPANPFPSLNNKVIIDWNNATFDALESPNYQHVLTTTRLYAMVHIAQFDALNSIRPVYKNYCYTGTDAAAHPIAAAAAAAHTVLLHHLPAKKSLLDGLLAKAVDSITNNIAKQKGIALGLQCANAIIELRKNDGAFQNPVGAVAPSVTAGVYQAVPPFDFVFAPFWKDMKPFSLQKPEQFRSVPYPALNSAVYKKDFTEVKLLGDKNSTVRTAEQTLYAKFWYEFSEMGWNRIAKVAAGTENTDLLSTARLFAMLNIALADSYTAGWDSKFYYNFWRPYTAINSNDDEKSWEPLMTTPPVQDYPSTHSVLGNAGATVLTYFYGNNYAFTTVSTTSATKDETRNFKSFLKAADENADSRVMAGIHFRFSCNAGQEMGNKIGKWVIQNTLQLLK